MKINFTKNSEWDRLQDLHSLEILDSEEEKSFNDLVDLAALICGCRFAGISFVDENRQWFKASHNLPFKQTERDIAFCNHTIKSQELFIVENANTDPQFSNNSLVTGNPHIIFYAGAPIVSSRGNNLGSVCVMDDASGRQLTSTQKDALEKISRQITYLLELRMRNRTIAEHAATLLEEEKNNTRIAISEKENDRKFMARELHENFAQTLAAIKLYIEFAEQSTDNSEIFMKKSKDNLVKMINDFRKLSHIMVPGREEEIVLL
jgi:signal transduction histidine kinase